MSLLNDFRMSFLPALISHHKRSGENSLFGCINLATSSSELYKMAQLVFKGKKEPEKNYSLSVIDYYSLLNYKGEELKPGYGIQINANEYYDENDDIYTALKQYLFITDVSYTLRKDDDLNITVNSIKYQEKLLQSLVKLIR